MLDKRKCAGQRKFCWTKEIMLDKWKFTGHKTCVWFHMCKFWSKYFSPRQLPNQLNSKWAQKCM
jgi:hypothetical protein